LFYVREVKRIAFVEAKNGGKTKEQPHQINICFKEYDDRSDASVFEMNLSFVWWQCVSLTPFL
jgi:hypothetical protein